MNLPPPKSDTLSPMMAQWYACKKKAKDALLLFRLGDFYEAFYEDAVILSEELDLTLTKRQEVPMSGIPAHASEGYVQKLVEKGFLVAIAEQVEDAKQAKGLVKRDVVKTISPGTVLSPNFLSEKKNNFFGCIAQVNTIFALALLDLSTGELRVIEVESMRELYDELVSRSPAEILISKKGMKALEEGLNTLRKSKRFRLNVKEDWHFDIKNSYQFLSRHFNVHSLDGFGLKGKVAAPQAISALLSHVQDELTFSIDHVQGIKVDHLSSYMAIDQATQSHLEIIEPLHKEGQGLTLLSHLDHTSTAMGGRLFKSWVSHPLRDVSAIQKRQQAASELIANPNALTSLTATLKQIRDIERLIMRVKTGYSNPRDLIALAHSLDELPTVCQALTPLSASLIVELKNSFPDCQKIATAIWNAIAPEPPVKLGEGHVIREGFSSALDELRALKSNSQEWIARYQGSLREAHDIKNLKVIYSKAFGYCIEVSRGQSSRMPESFTRRQTLVNAERFISPELKEYEEKILTAEDKILRLEQTLYGEVKNEVAKHQSTITSAAKGVALIDALLSLAIGGKRAGYVCPKVDDSGELSIVEGRHPVIETALDGDTFIANDCHLSQRDSELLLITGPNMAGKSTYIRQVALITIMAQIGSYVPAKSAKIGVVDKVFSRIGASDDLSRGQSTFMIEMTETANILNNATPKSLIILDEIGRGTSTYDGISIAWAVAEHLLKLQGEGVKTLFATHYYELTELTNEFPAVKNVNVAVHEADDQVLFLRKIVDGAADKSYGIHVARLAGLPHSLIKRANAILHKLESTPKSNPKSQQLTLFSMEKEEPKESPITEELKKMDLNGTAPIEALQKLIEWQSTLS